MATTLVRIWRRLFPFHCEWCQFTSRTPQGIGRHRKRCKLRREYTAEVGT